MHLSTLLPVTLILTLAASRPRSNPAAPAVDIPHQSPAFPASAQPLPSLPKTNLKNRAVGLTAWTADANEEGIVDGTYANLTPAQRKQLNSIKNGSFPGVDPVVLWGRGGNKTAGASGTGNASGHYALSFASEYGPIVVGLALRCAIAEYMYRCMGFVRSCANEGMGWQIDGNIDVGRLGITVDIVIFESKVGHFVGSLPKGLAVKVQGRIVSPFPRRPFTPPPRRQHY